MSTSALHTQETNLWNAEVDFIPYFLILENHLLILLNELIILINDLLILGNTTNIF